MRLTNRIQSIALAMFASAALWTGSAWAAPIYLDITNSTGTSGGWNMLGITDSGASGAGGLGQTVANMIDTNSNSTGISAEITQRFNGLNSSGTSSPSGAAAEFGDHGADGGYGNFDAPFPGGNEVTIQNSQITFSNLIDTNTYDFTFFASRLSVSDNRETLYELIGQNTDSATLNPSNNTSNVATVIGISPDINGQIVLNITEGANNTNSTGFYYLGALKIVAVPEPASIALIGVGGLVVLTRRRR